MSFQEPPYEPSFNPPERAFPAAANSGPPQYLLNNIEESVSTASTVKSPNMAGRFAIGGLVAVMAVGGAFAVRTAMSGPTGPSSSDEAVTQMFQALDNDDFVGVAELMHPAERESIAQPVFQLIDNYARLEIIASSVDTSNSSFSDIEVDGLTYSVETTGERLHWVTTTGGTITSNASIDPPAGPLMDRLGIEASDVEPESATADMGAEPFSFAVVEVDGSWYVSLWYTLAESIRRDEGDTFIGLGNGPAPAGAATPDAAMEQLVRRIAEFDGEGIITLMDPQEAAALYDYSPYFLADMNDALAEAKAQLTEENISWTIDSIDYEANEQNGRQIVSFKSIAVTADMQGETVSVSIADGCLLAEFEGETIDSCDIESDYGEMYVDLNQELKELLNLSDKSLAAFAKLDAVDAGMTAVERDGRWYISIMPTILGTVNDHLGVLDSDDLFAMYTDFEALGDDPDRLLNQLDDLTGGMATGAFDQFNPLGAGGQFGAVSDEISGEFEFEFEPIETDGSALNGSTGIDNIVPEYFSMSASPESLWLSFDADLNAAPAVIAGAYVFGEEDGSIEVAEFAASVSPGILTGNGWVLRDLDGVTYATDSDRSHSYAFVNNFVIWAGSDSESVEMMMAQIDLLK